MNHEVLYEAAEEVRDAAVFLKARHPSLGDALLARWEAGLAAVLASPRMFACVDEAPPGYDIRSYPLKRFPYRIVYQLEADKLVVIAFAHTSRRPGYWSNRLADTIPPEDLT